MVFNGNKIISIKCKTYHFINVILDEKLKKRAHMVKKVADSCRKCLTAYNRHMYFM